MAAVLCLMFLPIMAAVLFMLGSLDSMSIGTVFAAVTFVLLSSGIVVGAMKMSKEWEDEPLDDRHA